MPLDPPPEGLDSHPVSRDAPDEDGDDEERREDADGGEDDGDDAPDAPELEVLHRQLGARRLVRVGQRPVRALETRELVRQDLKSQIARFSKHQFSFCEVPQLLHP